MSEQPASPAAGYLARWWPLIFFLIAVVVASVVLIVGLNDSGDPIAADESAGNPQNGEPAEPGSPLMPPSGSEIARGDDPVDLALTADGASAVGEDPLAEILEVIVYEDGTTTWVEIGVAGGSDSIDSARQDHDSSTYEVIVEDADGNLTTWIWELDNGDLIDGANRNDPAAPSATVSFTPTIVRFQLPDGVVDARRVEARTFSSPAMTEGEQGPKFVDRMAVDVAAQRTSG
jgi:hypothetical protein